MPISPHIRRLREKVGHELLVLPSAAVLPRDDDGRLLLVRLADTDQWGLIGGAVEPGESPSDCAVREAEEEASVQLELGRLLGVVGGPEYRVTYPNGDQTAYVVATFEASVTGGEPQPDQDETTDVGWFALDDLPLDQMGALSQALLGDVGYLPPHVARPVPLLVLVTGLQGTGKSTTARMVADRIGAVVLSHDWAMSGLRPFPSLQRALDDMEPPGHGTVGWSLLVALARSQLRAGKSVVLDGMARAAEIDLLERLAGDERVTFVAVMTECSDLALHRSRIEGRTRDIPDWYEVTWGHVERSRTRWDPARPVHLRLDAARPLAENAERVRAFLGDHHGQA